MKILLATYWPIPHVGGVWPYMLQLKKQLVSRGHEVDLMGYSEDNFYVYKVDNRLKLPKEKLLPLLQAKLSKKAFPALHANAVVRYAEFQRYVFELAAAYLGLDQYDIVHTQDLISTMCIQRVRPQKTALVTSIHGCVAHEMRRLRYSSVPIVRLKYGSVPIVRTYYDVLEFIGATSAEFIHVANQRLFQIYKNELEIPEKQLRIFHYGYDIEAFTERMRLASEVQRPANKKVIIFTGRLIEQKGVHHLITALKRLKRLRNDWICWIVGNGSKESELRVQSKAMNLDKSIVFWGKREDVPNLLSLADIFVLPSMIEIHPLSLIQAQLAGKAIVASDVGGIPEMVKHEETGILVPPGDAKALCERLNELLDHDEYRQTLGSNAKQWGMDHWSLETMVDRVLEMYHSAIAVKKNHKKD